MSALALPKEVAQETGKVWRALAEQGRAEWSLLDEWLRLREVAYGSSPTTPPSARRSRKDIERIQGHILNVLFEERPCTVRQVYYQLTSRGVVNKTEGEYKSTVCRLLGDMRRAGVVPFDWIADNTRWMRKPKTYSSLEAMLENHASAYRRDIWAEQDAYVEIWLEKDALSGVLYEETAAWDVPLMVTRGYSSLSYLHNAAETIAAEDKPAWIYYFGDYDPSGCDISRNVEERLREFAPDAEIHFERVAVNEDQIAQLNLPTRPTKKSDSRAKNFRGPSVEVDAIPPRVLRGMASECITKHIDNRTFAAVIETEQHERETLQGFLDGMRGAAE